MAACVVLTPNEVQNLICAELWLEKWGLLQQDSKMPPVAQDAMSDCDVAFPFQNPDSSSMNLPTMCASLSNMSPLFSADNTPNSADWDLTDLSLLSPCPGRIFDSAPASPGAAFAAEQLSEDPGYTLTGYTTLESPREDRACGKMEEEGEGGAREQSYAWNSHMGM